MWQAFRAIPVLYQFLAVLGVVGAISGAVYGVWSHIDSGGYDRCVTEGRVAAADAQENNRGNIVETEKSFDKKTTEVNALADPDGPVGPYTSAAVDRMP